jgi:hypothetical protein
MMMMPFIFQIKGILVQIKRHHHLIRDGYLTHLALADATARAAALRERGPFKLAQVEPFKAGPGYIMVFADMLERCLKLSTTITVARYYGDNEELGMAYFLSS